MNQFTKEDLKNLTLLLSRTVIEGKEAITVVALQQKIHRMMMTLTSKTEVTTPPVESTEVQP